MSGGWSLYVIVLIVVNILGCGWLLFANRSVQIDPREKGRSTGHDFDGIEELNNPLPAWWTWLFIGTILFSVGYFVLYPGFGSFAGTLGWSSAGQHAGEVAEAKARFGPLFERYFATPIPELVREPQAVAMGSRVFANNCTACHGSDARGNRGYPDLTDGDWLHGGAPENVVQTITHGRQAVMPAMATIIGGDAGVEDVTNYVLSLSGRDHDAAAAARGSAQFAAICSACHQADGRGNPLVGAPNLTDDVWLHGGKVEDIRRIVGHGVANQMPAHEAILTPEQIHLVATYVLSLSSQGTAGAGAEDEHEASEVGGMEVE
ncbi:MAG: cytochrome-c oxidase, cbb3-type subunit III [Myxococcota bacterium]